MSSGGRNLRVGLEFRTFWGYALSEVPLFGRLTRGSQGEKVVFFYDDNGKLAAGPQSQIPSHLLPEDPEEYVMILFFLSPN